MGCTFGLDIYVGALCIGESDCDKASSITVVAENGCDSHFSILKPFSSGDVVEWFQRFDLCSDANKWEDEVKAVKMLTLLEGEALAAWLYLAEETKKDCETAKKQLIDGLMPITYTLLDKFHARKLLPRESRLPS